MARSLETRIARLEAPHGNLARPTARYTMLRASYMVLSRLEGDPMPSETELWALAQAEAASGQTPDFTAALQAVWTRHENL